MSFLLGSLLPPLCLSVSLDTLSISSLFHSVHGLSLIPYTWPDLQNVNLVFHDETRASWSPNTVYRFVQTVSATAGTFSAEIYALSGPPKPVRSMIQDVILNQWL